MSSPAYVRLVGDQLELPGNRRDSFLGTVLGHGSFEKRIHGDTKQVFY